MPTHTQIATPEKENACAPWIAGVVGSPRAGEACGTARMGRLAQTCCAARCQAAKSRRTRGDERHWVEVQPTQVLTGVRALRGTQAWA